MNKTCSFKDDNVFISVTITSFEKKIKIKLKAELPPPPFTPVKSYYLIGT